MQVWLVDHPTFLDEFARFFLRSLLYRNALDLLDSESQERVRLFYHRADSCRCIIGRLLPRVLLSEKGVSAENIQFAKTDAGKPYFARRLLFFLSVTTGVSPPIGYNISHDNELVAIAFAPGEHCLQIGVDVMRERLPRGERFTSFLRAVGDTLTQGEKRLLSGDDVPENEAISRFYLIWTIKEAYTKAIGLGLGFDLQRIEYDVATKMVTVDGVAATEWRFETSQVTVDEEAYRVTVAQFVGSGNGGGTVVALTQGQIVRTGASSFVRKAIRQIKGLELEGQI
ncbi:hypothetical protein EDB85DRAFT_2070431 [Lactarius pseudohatsudake]|nr:hypothetical protein EDB85DRAFT_2070431 [Lactarius pseudohatsudake]